MVFRADILLRTSVGLQFATCWGKCPILGKPYLRTHKTYEKNYRIKVVANLVILKTSRNTFFDLKSSNRTFRPKPEKNPKIVWFLGHQNFSTRFSMLQNWFYTIGT